MRSLTKFIVVIAVVVLMVGSLGAWYWRGSGKSTGEFRTANVTRGDLVAAIGATGTVEPEEVVDVGAQIAGRIETFGTDPHTGKPIDYGSEIEKDTVLAHIDEALYQADVDQAAAGLSASKANVEKSKADLLQMQAKLQQAQRDWDRAKKVGASDALSQSDFDAYEAAYETAKANVAVVQAQIVQAEKGVAQAEATLARAHNNLSYCTIKSPVRGVIIDRRVNIGQTVVASLSAPSLFLIAKDLKRMQVWVAVNEADIGNIKPAQPVSFTVDAYPGQTFTGEVSKVRLNATMTQNVVTYTVEVTTDNSSGKLLPYLTANVQFEISRHTDVLVVPNAALRWTPKADQIAPDAREAVASATTRPSRSGQARSTRPPSTRPAGAPEGGETTRGMLWTQDGNYVRPIRVRVGATDGSNTEVTGEQVKEGMTVILGEQTDVASAGAQAGGAGGNPFLPNIRGGRGGGGGGGGRGAR